MSGIGADEEEEEEGAQSLNSLGDEVDKVNFHSQIIFDDVKVFCYLFCVNHFAFILLTIFVLTMFLRITSSLARNRSLIDRLSKLLINYEITGSWETKEQKLFHSQTFYLRKIDLFMTQNRCYYDVVQLNCDTTKSSAKFSLMSRSSCSQIGINLSNDNWDVGSVNATSWSYFVVEEFHK